MCLVWVTYLLKTNAAGTGIEFVPVHELMMGVARRLVHDSVMGDASVPVRVRASDAVRTSTHATWAGVVRGLMRNTTVGVVQVGALVRRMGNGRRLDRVYVSG